ncbi:hypothetical protein BVY02_02310 [bacterium J17]|nr:hypothetical protein BVY02_02310 [bacterium J17]
MKTIFEKFLSDDWRELNIGEELSDLSFAFKIDSKGASKESSVTLDYAVSSAQFVARNKEFADSLGDGKLAAIFLLSIGNYQFAKDLIEGVRQTLSVRMNGGDNCRQASQFELVSVFSELESLESIIGESCREIAIGKSPAVAASIGASYICSSEILSRCANTLAKLSFLESESFSAHNPATLSAATAEVLDLNRELISTYSAREKAAEILLADLQLA